MNLFRSEEHARDWEEYDPRTAHLLRPVEWWADTFSSPMFRARARGDFITWATGPDGAAAFGELRERLAPPRPDVRATTAAAIALSNVDISVVDDASPDDRSVERQLFGQWPAAVPVEIARHWRNTARAMIVAIPAEPLSDVDQQLWTETRAGRWLSSREQQLARQQEHRVQRCLRARGCVLREDRFGFVVR